MDVLRARNLNKWMILWRVNRNRSSLDIITTYARVRDYDSSFTESFLDKRWVKTGLEKVPRGFVPVYVGPEEMRFVIPMVCLSMPEFRKLMESTEDEFGFEQKGGLKIACEEDDFEEILNKCLARNKDLAIRDTYSESGDDEESISGRETSSS